MRRPPNRFPVAFLLAGLGIVLLTLSATGRLAPAEGVWMIGARPFLTVFNDLGRRVDNFISTARDLTSLRTRNAQLQTLAETLTIDNLRLKETETENVQLRSLLRFAQLNPNYDYRGGQIIARVISRGPSNYLSTIGIDLGTEHGIAAGMPVVTERGLVGRIQRVGPVSSTVLLITDPSSGVQALTQRSTSRAVGIVTGRAGALPVMEFIPQDADISVGDLVISSGLGGAFPKKLIIGQVVEVQRRDYEMFQQAVIRPTVNFDRLEFVLIITNFRPLPGQPEELEGVG
jgi:rod shape-determining protein MreC